jgi:anti-sigma factor RsiW
VSGACRELRPLLGAYLLGGLEPEEEAAVAEHVAGCPACAAEHARLAPLPGLLTLAVGASRATAEPPSPAVEERILDAVARERPRRRRLRLGAMGRRGRVLVASGAVATALAVAAVVGIVSGGSHGYLELHATSTLGGGKARAELASTADGTVMHLWVSGLPHNTAAVYEVHCDSPAWSASAGTFRVDAQGRAAVVLTTAARRGEYNRIRILRRTGTGAHLVFAAALS